MSTKDTTTIDRAKAGWPAGPWDGEPDRSEWTDAATGLPCVAIRGMAMGQWCGYVGVSRGHPMYEKNGFSNIVYLEVHGGVTFTGRPQKAPCGQEQLWWIGFDCAHAGDVYPAHPSEPGGVYRTLEFVQHQCAALAAQLNAYSE